MAFTKSIWPGWTQVYEDPLAGTLTIAINHEGLSETLVVSLDDHTALDRSWERAFSIKAQLIRKKLTLDNVTHRILS